METKKVNSKIDDVANKEKQAASGAQDKGREVVRKSTDVVHAGRAGARGVAKTPSDGVEETAEKAGHGIKEVATKATDVVHEVAQKVIHEAREAATKIDHRVHALVDKAADKVKSQ